MSFAREVRMQNLVSFATEISNRNLDGNPWWGMQNLFSSVITEIWNKSLDGNLWREDAKSSQLCTNLLWKHSLTTFPIQNKSGFVGLFYGQTVSFNKCMFCYKNHFTLTNNHLTERNRPDGCKEGDQQKIRVSNLGNTNEKLQVQKVCLVWFCLLQFFSPLKIDSNSVACDCLHLLSDKFLNKIFLFDTFFNKMYILDI